MGQRIDELHGQPHLMQIGVLTAIGVSVVAGVPGLVLFSVARAVGWTFPSWGRFVVEALMAAAQLGWLALLLARERDPLGARTLGLRRGPRPLGWPSITGAVAVVLLPIVGASVIPQVLGGSALEGSTYGTVDTATLPLTLAMVLVRYPVTVLAEEAFFRGWLQPRLTWAPAALSGILFGAYHALLQPISTVPSLICFGIALGLIRQWTGDIRATTTLHYLSDAGFFLLNYR